MAKHGCLESTMTVYFEELKSKDWSKYRAGAFALEVGDKTARVHIQFYVERRRPVSFTTYGREFGCMEHSHQTVRHPKGSWDYCTGQGVHEGKFAIDRFQFGEPVLYGNTEDSHSLKWCVEQIISGDHPASILRRNPYAWAVHSTRIWQLWSDLQELEKHGTLMRPAAKR